jgi:hypothetical protein
MQGFKRFSEARVAEELAKRWPQWGGGCCSVRQDGGGLTGRERLYMHKMKKYLRLIVAFSVGLAILILTIVTISFLRTWLPANGFNISKDVFTITSMGALGVALGIGAQLCIKEGKRIETSKNDNAGD